MGPYGEWCWGYQSLDGAYPQYNLDGARRGWCWGYHSLDGAYRWGSWGCRGLDGANRRCMGDGRGAIRGVVLGLPEPGRRPPGG